MSYILKVVEVLGKITFCLFPQINLKRTPCGHLRDKLFKLLYMMFLMGGITEFLDSTLNNSREVLTGANNLSELLGFYCQYVGGHCSNFIIRAVGIGFACEIRSLISLLTSKNSSGFRLKDSLWIVFCTLLFASIAIGYGYAIILINVTFNVSPEYTLKVIPMKYLRPYNVLTSVATAGAILFASIFLVQIGTLLRSWLDGYSEKCEGLLLSRRSTKGFYPAAPGKVHAQLEISMAALQDEFFCLREAFDKYGRVGGVYALVLLFNFTLLIIRFLSSRSIYLKSMIVFDPSSQFFCYLLPFGILAIVITGSMLETSVFRHRAQMADLTVQIPRFLRPPELTEFLNWQSSWTWRLSALGLFDIKASLIPGVVATIITYFIFLFQLGASEMRS